MGVNRRKMEADRKAKADAAAAARRATDAQKLEDAGRLIVAWNERQARRMPLLFAPTIGAAIAAGYWFLWVRCPACRTTQSVDLRTLDRHPNAAVTSLIPTLSCLSCRPNAPFAELVRLSLPAWLTKCAKLAGAEFWASEENQISGLMGLLIMVSIQENTRWC